jgi:hypothetical protein
MAILESTLTKTTNKELFKVFFVWTGINLELLILRIGGVVLIQKYLEKLPGRECRIISKAEQLLGIANRN